MVDDGWLRYRSYQGGDDAIGAIEQQVYQYPAVSNFAPNNADKVDADTFRHRLWNAKGGPGPQLWHPLQLRLDLASA